MIKNYKKLFLSFGAAAVLSSAAAFSSLAASGGWVSENGVWNNQEASGNYAYNTWKTSGDNSYYLDNNGVIAVNQWIDDTYYVDDDGVMAKKFLDPVIRRYFPEESRLVLRGHQRKADQG